MPSAVTYESVSKAFEELLSENVKPTSKNIRERLGTGSFRDIAPIVRKCNESYKVSSPMDESRQAKIFKDLEAINAEYEESKEEAQRRYDALLSENQALVDQNASVELRLEELAKEIAKKDRDQIAVETRLQAEKDERKAEVEKLTASWQSAQAELVELKIRKGDWEASQAELTKAKAELADLKVKMAKMEGIAEGKASGKAAIVQKKPTK